LELAVVNCLSGSKWASIGPVLFGGQHDEPLAALALDGDGLDFPGYRPVLVDLDVSHALEADAGDPVVRGGVPPAAVPSCPPDRLVFSA
jgi:hypothetical protein